MTRNNKKGKKSASNQENDGCDRTGSNSGRKHPGYSFGVMIKTVTGEAHEMNVACPSADTRLEALQQAVETELEVPVSRQRLLLDSGRTVLRNVAQLQAAIASLHGGSRLVIQLIPKLHCFSSCPEHPEYELKILCVPCGKFLCQKCLFRHITRTDDWDHALADLEDDAQFAEAIKPILQQADAQLLRSLKLTTNEAETNLARFNKTFEKANSRKRWNAKAVFKYSVATVQQQSRGVIRTTLEAAAWLHLSRAGLFALPTESESSSEEADEAEEDEDEESEDGDAEEDEDPPRLVLVTPPGEQPSDSFPICERHNRLQKTVFCVQCAEMMCLKCFALHVNKQKGHQCADIEDADQFTEMVQKRFDAIDEHMEQVAEDLKRCEADSLVDFRCAQGQVWPAWEHYLESLKAQFHAEARQIHRKGISTPTEILQWVLGAESAEICSLQKSIEARRIADEPGDDTNDDNVGEGEEEEEDEEVEGEDDDDDEEVDGEEWLLLLCPQGHVLSRIDGDGRETPWVCDGCEYNFDPCEGDVLQCRRCRFDLCSNCENEQRLYLTEPQV